MRLGRQPRGEDLHARLKKHQSKEQKNFEVDYQGRFKYYDNEK